MSDAARDEYSVAGKELSIAEQTSLLVIGAGEAGVAAAIAAAKRGIAVTLVDENPVPFETMAADVPLHFGQRMGGATRNHNAMLETLAADPRLAEAFDVGVDVRLGTIAWGLFTRQPTVGWLPGPLAGLADRERSWLIGCRQIIVAAGRRDMGLAFPGWELPGVMGASAAQRLAARYGALEARRAVVLGSSTETLLAIETLRRAGVEIAAVIEQAEAPLASSPALDAAVPVLRRHVIARAEGDAEGVRSVTAVAIDDEGRRLPGSERRIDCDTVVLGVGAVPALELLEAAGCAVAFDARRGGHAPVLDARQQTSLPGIHAIGDCAGIWAAKSSGPAISQREAEAAVASVAAALGNPDAGELAAPPPPATAEADLGAYRCAWVRASVVEAEGSPYVCQCEEVTAREILEVRPPRYLGWTAPTQKAADLASLLGEGPPNPDQVKRLTRAGMGLCQGRRCREQVAALLALGAGCELAEIPLASFRAPVRPLPLSLLADSAESPEIGARWDTWFGMPGQWVPFWRAPRLYRVSERDLDTPAASE